ncbi:MAG: class I tRNA ligase family protein, partial [Chitinivibrionia bacterium]|nr:class I tRNA ligase family protein [Chitinivibrionia bacterium]
MELYKKKNKPLLVTMALPYANGSIHLGHLVEAVIADVFVRAQKMTGRDTIYICADDTHGTPIQISAMKQNITPEQLISKAFDEHTRDYAIYGIGFDKYYTTNSEENRIWMEKIYGELQKNSMINKKTLQQFYCEHDKRFLPDRFVKGDCPKCGAQNQYGDNCEV